MRDAWPSQKHLRALSLLQVMEAHNSLKSWKWRTKAAVNTYDKVSQAIQSTIGDHQRGNRSSFKVSVELSLAVQYLGDSSLSSNGDIRSVKLGKSANQARDRHGWWFCNPCMCDAQSADESNTVSRIFVLVT